MTKIPNCCRLPETNADRTWYQCLKCGTTYHVVDGTWTLEHREMSAEGKSFVVACMILVVLILGGIFSNWYGVLDDRRPIPIPRPDRPAHPASIYYPPGVPQPTVPGDPGWRTTK